MGVIRPTPIQKLGKKEREKGGGKEEKNIKWVHERNRHLYLFVVLLLVLGSIALEQVSKLLKGVRRVLGGGPEIGGEVSVRLADGEPGGVDEVTKSLGGATGRGVSVVDTGEGEELAGSAGGNETGTAGGGDTTETDRTALARDLARNGVGESELGTPISTANRDSVHLGGDDGTADGGGDFLGALNTQSDVAVQVTDDDPGFKASALTSVGLLLDGGDLHEFILELLAKEVINDLVLLDGHGEQVDILDRLDLLFGDEATELGAGDPSGLLITSAAAGLAVTASTGTSATATAASLSITKTSRLRGGNGGSVSHCLRNRV